MKRAIIIGLAIALTVVIGSAVYAHGPWGQGMGYSTNPAGPVNLENWKKFQQETLTLREEVMTKKMELRNEYSKTPRDYDRIASLKKEIVDLQTKIHATAEKYGLPATGFGCGMRHGQGMMGQCGPCNMAE